MLNKVLLDFYPNKNYEDFATSPSVTVKLDVTPVDPAHRSVIIAFDDKDDEKRLEYVLRRFSEFATVSRCQ
ncbi:hypothetical protein K2Q08_02910 [Patescibacteria group bacterium]|nr:hypothetical protein [Patescibacteria group bacterium]